MIGSRQGWKEAPYVPARPGRRRSPPRWSEIEFDWGQVKLVPGLSGHDEAGVAEVMRGEETQVFGVLTAMGGSGLACLPGTHSKWVRVEDGRIIGFTTHMTGEVFGALRGHTILGRMMRDGPRMARRSMRACDASGDPGGLLHHIFGARAEVLAGRLAETDAAAYLSGILIGHEVRAALGQRQGQVVHVIGSPELAALYAARDLRTGRVCRTPRRRGGGTWSGLDRGARDVAITDWLTRCPLVAILRGVKPDEAVAIGVALEAPGDRHRRGAAELAAADGKYRAAVARIRRPAAYRRRHGDDAGPGCGDRRRRWQTDRDAARRCGDCSRGEATWAFRCARLLHASRGLRDAGGRRGCAEAVPLRGGQPGRVACVARRLADMARRCCR